MYIRVEWDEKEDEYIIPGLINRACNVHRHMSKLNTVKTMLKTTY